MIRYLEYTLDGEEFAALEVEPGCFACILPVRRPTLEAAERFVEQMEPKVDPETGTTSGHVLFALRHVQPYATDLTIVEL